MLEGILIALGLLLTAVLETWTMSPNSDYLAIRLCVMFYGLHLWSCMQVVYNRTRWWQRMLVVLFWLGWCSRLMHFRYVNEEAAKHLDGWVWRYIGGELVWKVIMSSITPAPQGPAEEVVALE